MALQLATLLVWATGYGSAPSYAESKDTTVFLKILEIPIESLDES